MPENLPPVEEVTQSEVTQLLGAWSGGDEEALDRLFPLIYDDLRRVARNRLRGEGPEPTFQATALVNEAYLRLAGMGVEWTGRVHFFAVAASAMRRILVDRARRRHAKKRGAGEKEISLEEIDVAQQSSETLLALDQSLEALAAIDARKARVVELRFFAGLTIDETAEVLSVSHTTVEKDMKLAKAWLARHMA